MSENIKITLQPAPVQQISLKTGPTTIMNVTSGGGGNAFGIVNVTGQNNLVAAAASDTLRVVAGSGILVTNDAPNNALTIIATGGSSFDQLARDTANGAFLKANTANITGEAAFAKANVANTTAEAAFANANNSIKTSAQIRANVSNTHPIRYDTTTGVFSHAASGVTATGYGDGVTVPKIDVDANGHVTSITNTAISFPAAVDQYARDKANTANTTADASIVFGQAAFNKANTANITGEAAFAKANLANTLAQSSYDKANTAIYTQAQIRANVSNTHPIRYDSTTGIFSHAESGVTATGYGDSVTVPKIDVDANGHVTSITNTAIAFPAAVDQYARTTANTANVTAEAAFAKANVANTTADASIVFGQAAFNKANGAVQLGYPKINVAANATLVSATTNNSTLFLLQGNGITLAPNAAQSSITVTSFSYGTLNVASGGTGQTSYANGELLIGNTISGGLDKRTLTQGTGILITNGNGTITIDATGGSATDQYARDKANGAVQLGYPKINVAANATLVAATTNNDTLILIQGSGILLTPNAGNSSIVISATGGAAVDQYARDKANGAVQLGYPRINVAANATLVAATTNNDILFLLAGSNMVLESNAAQSSITLSSFDQYARDKANTANITAEAAFAKANVANTTAEAAFANANNSIKTSAQIRDNISNAYPVYYNSTTGVISFVPATANGQLLIGNTVSGTFDVNTIANTGIGGILITNDKGSITLAANVIWVRGNVSGTAPINYAPSTGIFSHATSGVAATIYGGANTVPVVTVDTFGHITLAANSAINNLDASVVTTGNLVIARGGTGRSLTGVTHGQLLIGNTTNSGFDLNTLSNTGSGGILITNGAGTITLGANVIWVRGNVSGTAPINYDATTGIFTHATSGVSATIYGGANTVPVVTVDDKGHITLAANSAINNLNASTITTGNLVIARGGTGRSLTGVTDGQLLIGNTTNSGFDLTTLSNTGSGGILITNGNGTITLGANVIWIRGNISATTPIAYAPATGVITHVTSGVAATIYGGANTVPVVTVDTFGHITLAANSAVNNLDASTVTTGNLVIARGGTGRSLTGVTSGQLLIGNTTNSGFDLNTLANTGSGGILITNGAGSITLGANVIWVRGNVSNTTPILYDPATGIFSHKTSGVAATIYGGANTVPVVTVDTFGHITLAANSLINNLDASTIITGNLVIARGGTGRSLTGVTDGQLLIGNTTNSGFDLRTLTQGTNITITNQPGTITISASGGGGNSYGVINIGGTGSANINSGSANDTLKILAGPGIILTTDAAAESLTIEATGGASTDQFARDTANAAWLQANTANAIANSISGGVSLGLIDAYVRGYGITIQ